MKLTKDSKERKATPVVEGVLDYFPLAIAAVARVSKKANEKHNPGEPMHWSRDKSTDHADCVARHLIDRGTIDPEFGELHDAGQAWRSLAQLQIAEEKRLSGYPLNQAQASTRPSPIGVAWSASPANSKNQAAPTAAIGVAWSDPSLDHPAMPPPPVVPQPNTITLADPNRGGPLGMTLIEAAGGKLGSDGRVYVPVDTAPPARPKNTYWYVATPYTKYPAGRLAAFTLACQITARLMRARVKCFSPIAHSHPIANFMPIGAATDHELWMAMDAPLMEAASGLLVVKAEGWDKSAGVAEEIARFQKAGKNIVFWDPATAIPIRDLKF